MRRNGLIRFSFILILVILFLVSCFYSCKKETEIIDLSTPLNLSATKGIYPDQIILSWEASPDSKTFQIYRLDSLESSYKLIGETGYNAFADSTVINPNTRYYYKIRGKNSDNHYSEFSNFDYGYTYNFNTSIPTLSGSYREVNDKKINIYWDEIKGTEHYVIFKSSDGENYYAYDSTIYLAYTDLNPVAQKRNYYKIIARLKNSQSSFSNLVSFFYYKYYSSTNLINLGDDYSPLCFSFDDDNNIYVFSANPNKHQRIYDINGTLIREYDIKGLDLSEVGDIKYVAHNLLIASCKNNYLYNLSSETISNFYYVGRSDNSYSCYNKISIDNNDIYLSSDRTFVKLDLNGNIIKTLKNYGSDIDCIYVKSGTIYIASHYTWGYEPKNHLRRYDSNLNLVADTYTDSKVTSIGADIQGFVYYNTDGTFLKISLGEINKTWDYDHEILGQLQVIDNDVIISISNDGKNILKWIANK
jgi:hypothetical protein